LKALSDEFCGGRLIGRREAAQVGSLFFEDVGKYG